MTFISGAYISGAHFVINRAWALHHKLGQPELLTDPQLRHPDDSVEGQLWERKQGHEDTKRQVPPHASTTRLEITSSPPRRVGRDCNTFDHWRNGRLITRKTINPCIYLQAPNSRPRPPFDQFDHPITPPLATRSPLPSLGSNATPDTRPPCFEMQPFLSSLTSLISLFACCLASTDEARHFSSTDEVRHFLPCFFSKNLAEITRSEP